jgi:hypothetical protein
MQTHPNLFEYGRWFDRTFRDKPAHRSPTWRAALGIFAQRGGVTIVETGCQRFANDWGAGCSTRLLALALKELCRGRLHSVDNSKEHLEVAKAIIHQDGTDAIVDFYLEDSIQFLQTFTSSIDLLYLDSFDYSQAEPGLSACQGHQLNELEAAFDKLSHGAVVILDDNSLPQGGKTRLAKRFLVKRDWLCVLDWQQSVWIRSTRPPTDIGV